MKTINRYLCIMMFAVLLIGCCGCSNQKDIEDSCYILALGFEKTGNKYLVRYSYADFDNEKSNSGTKVPSKSVTFLADSFADANKKWTDHQMNQLNFGHLKVVIFGNGKKDPKIIKELLEYPQIAKSVFVLDTKESIADMFEKEKDLSISFGEYMAKSIENSEKIAVPKNYTLGRIMY